MKFLKRHLVLKETRVGGRTRTLTIFSYLWLTLFAVAFVLLFVWVRLQVFKTGYEIVRLREERDRHAVQGRTLEMQLMNLTSLKHVDDKARQMRFAVPARDRMVFVTLSDDDTFLQNLRAFFASWFRPASPALPAPQRGQ